MPAFGPIKRKKFIHCLRELGFDGPYSGKKHQFMIKDDLVLRIPNPHTSAIGKELLSKILKQAKIDRKTWEAL